MADHDRCECKLDKDTAGGNKRRNKPLVKLVDNLQVHVTRRPHLFVDQVQRRVGDKLVQVSMVVLLQTKYIKPLSIQADVYEHCVTL